MKKIYQVVLVLLLLAIFVFGFLYLMSNDPTINRKTYKIVSHGSSFYATSYDTIPNGIQFIDIRRNTLVKVQGDFVIEEPKNR